MNPPSLPLLKCGFLYLYIWRYMLSMNSFQIIASNRCIFPQALTESPLSGIPGNHFRIVSPLPTQILVRNGAVASITDKPRVLCQNTAPNLGLPRIRKPLFLSPLHLLVAYVCL